MPGNAVLLVDTFDTEDGIANAIATGLRMRERGQKLAGIRLDSGDLAYLSVRARELLDADHPQRRRPRFADRQALRPRRRRVAGRAVDGTLRDGEAAGLRMADSLRQILD